MPTSAPRALLRIGQLSVRTGLSPDTLRHYERLRLLHVERRTRSGFREYAPAAVRRVQTIQAALAIGFTLKELSRLFAERASGRPPCTRARQLAGEKLQALEQQIEQLVRLRSSLQRVLHSWDRRLASTGRGEAAQLLESLIDSEDAPARAAKPLDRSRANNWRSRQGASTTDRVGGTQWTGRK